MITRRSLFVPLGGGALALAGCATEQVTADGRFPIMSVLESCPDVSNFRSALRSTNLDELLAGPGPFTVFAPTNAALEGAPPHDARRRRRRAAQPDRRRPPAPGRYPRA